MWSSLIILFLSSLFEASATNLNLQIPPTVALPSPSTLLSSTFATLTTHNQTLHTPLRRSNKFIFPSIPAGSYLCDIYARDFAFTPLRIDVSAQGKVGAWQTFRGNEWDNKGERVGGGSGEEVTVDIQVLGAKNYYESRGGFSPASLLQNPMILIAIVGMGMMFGMPYLMDNMDPETKKEFEEQQAKGGLASAVAGGNPLEGFDVASWMAGASSKTSGAEEGPPAAKARRRG